PGFLRTAAEPVETPEQRVSGRCSALREVTMVNATDRWPDFPYLGHPGCCPRCGVQLRPQASQVVAGGSWSKGDGKGGIMTGGHLFSCHCPNCGTTLLSCADGWPKWEDVDPSRLQWFQQA